MNKGLNAFNELKEGHWFDFADTYFSLNPRLKMDLVIIEKALKDSEKLDIEASNALNACLNAQNIVRKKLIALEIIKELILEDLVFDDKEQKINFSFGVSTLSIKIKDKYKYDLLKEALE